MCVCVCERERERERERGLGLGLGHSDWSGRSAVQSPEMVDFSFDRTLTQGLKILGEKLAWQLSSVPCALVPHHEPDLMPK